MVEHHKKNFLVSYSGRVGSTALVDSLKIIPNFLIPVFEEMDAWYVEKHDLYHEINADNVGAAIDAMYSLHASTEVSVGFKWRVWGNVGSLAESLHKHGTIVFNLVRADAFEFFSSLYLSDIVHSEFNAAQFLLKDASSEEERCQILFRYRMQTHQVDLSQFRSLFERGLSVERDRLRILGQMQLAGITIVTIFYEDFAYKRYRFLNAFVRRLGHPGISHVPTPTIKKVGLPYPSELFANREDVVSADWLMDAICEWDRVVAPSALETLAI